MSDRILSIVRKELQDSSDRKIRDSVHRFFKEEVVLYGVSVPKINRISSECFREAEPLGKKRIFQLCEKLLESGYFEEAIVAFNWAYKLESEFTEEDFLMFERWLNRYVSNWAACDTLCNHAIGAFVERYPYYVGNLKEWAKSDNRWVRRGAAVTLVLPARKGLFLKDVFEIADILLEDEDDLVRKGYGWMLKEASKKRQKEVFDYVMKHKDKMPRTALRYAIEKMPEPVRKKAMAK